MAAFDSDTTVPLYNNIGTSTTLNTSELDRYFWSNGTVTLRIPWDSFHLVTNVQSEEEKAEDYLIYLKIEELKKKRNQLYKVRDSKYSKPVMKYYPISYDVTWRRIPKKGKYIRII